MREAETRVQYCGMCWLRDGEAKFSLLGPTARTSHAFGASSNLGSGETTRVEAVEPVRSAGRGELA